MEENPVPDRLAHVPVLVAAGFGLVAAAFAAWKMPALPTYVAVGGAATAAVAATLAGFAAARGNARTEARRIALQSEIANLQQRLKVQAEQLRHATMLDDTTGLLNRKAFLQRLDEVVQRDGRLEKPFALLYIDIEGFREFNQAYGRLDGDAVLRHVAHALQGVSRGTDHVGRLGGDEFGVALGECEDPRPVVDRLFIALDTASPNEGVRDRVRVAVGAVHVLDCRYGVDLGELFRTAEAALGSARGRGVSMYVRRDLPSRAPKAV